MKNKTKETNLERINKASLLDVLEEASVKLDEKVFRIKRHSDFTILIYDINDKVLYKPVKPILREINSSKKLEINLYHDTGTLKVTRTLGKEIINRLNKIPKK